MSKQFISTGGDLVGAYSDSPMGIDENEFSSPEAATSANFIPQWDADTLNRLTFVWLDKGWKYSTKTSIAFRNGENDQYQPFDNQNPSEELPWMLKTPNDPMLLKIRKQE